MLRYPKGLTCLVLLGASLNVPFSISAEPPALETPAAGLLHLSEYQDLLFVATPGVKSRLLAVDLTGFKDRTAYALPKTTPVITSVVAGPHGTVYAACASSAEAPQTLSIIKWSGTHAPIKVGLPLDLAPVAMLVLDPQSGLLYVGGGKTEAGKVLRLHTADLSVAGQAPLELSDGAPQSGWIDHANGLLYLGTDRGVATRLSLSDLSPQGSVSFQQRGNRLNTILVGKDRSIAFFASDRGHVIKIQLKDFSPLESLSLITGENGMGPGSATKTGDMFLFPALDEPFEIQKINPQPLGRAGSYKVPLAGHTLIAAAVDAQNGYAYYLVDPEKPLLIRYRFESTSIDAQLPL